MSRLFYKKPADWNWEAALPVGNGRLGAMIFGEVDMEHYQINEESVWSGVHTERENPDARVNLERVRELIFGGKIPEAERLLKYAFTGTPQSQRAYQTLGDMYIDLMDTVREPAAYERELDLETAVHTVRVKDQKSGVAYERECFCSAVDDVLVTHLSADRKGAVRAAAMVARTCSFESSRKEDGCIFYEGNSSGLKFCAGLKMVAGKGDVRAVGEHLVCEGADFITVYLAAATSFREQDVRETVRKKLEQAAQKEYDRAKEEHIAEYRSYFETCSLQLEYDREKDRLTTDERLRDISLEHSDPGIINTYFAFGRYLLISCSRPGTLPANLQGIWNAEMTPPWGSKYTININTEMNYWPAETLGLSECHLPLFDLLKRMEVRGRKTAGRMYGCRGFVAHHNTDLWADTAPQDMYLPATYWVMGGAWLCTHIWEHYEFTGDRAFLADMYPVIRSAVEFFLDFLVEKDGSYVTCPSVSPENTYVLPDGTSGCICYGATMDREILRDLFEICGEAGRILNEDNDFLEQVQHVYEKIPGLKVGSEGQLLEWMEEYGEAEPGHRHISHLYGLYPSSQIHRERTPELAEAAEVTLRRRLANGGGHTGWSRAWMICMYARLWEGEEAYQNLILLLQRSTLGNLFDYHPPFQIDGNFGAIAGIGEMLLQSDRRPGAKENRVTLLPALPEAWREGSILGIRARGGGIFDLFWKEGRLTELTVRTERENYQAELSYRGLKTLVILDAGEEKTYCTNNKNMLELKQSVYVCKKTKEAEL